MATDTASATTEALPRWSVGDLHESMISRSFVDAMEQAGAAVERAVATFDEHGVGAIEPRPVTDADGVAADEAIDAYNSAERQLDLLAVYVYATVTFLVGHAVGVGVS